MEILFLLVGLGFVGIGCAVVLAEVRARQGVAVPGAVVGFSTGKGAGSGSYYTVAEYEGSDGRARFVEGVLGSSCPLNSVGDAVTVLVQPDEPDQAAIQSSGTVALGLGLALMGLFSCVVFFAVFRVTAFSIASAGAVLAWTLYKIAGPARDKPMSWQAWRAYKKEALQPRVFTEETKAQIPWADPASLETAVANLRQANRFAVPGLLLFGIGLLVLGVWLHRKTDLFLAKAVRAPGVVVRMVASDSSDGTSTYSPVVEFEHAGERFRFKDSVGSSPPSHQTGDAVTVLYDPGRPSDARIDRGRWNRLIPILIGTAGALLCLLGLWVRKRRVAGKAW